MRYIVYLLIVALSSPNVFATDLASVAPQEISEFSSFENDFEGWNINGTDLNLGSGFIDWSIERSQERARDGATSLKFLLNNLNDAGKIWVEKPFAVEPNQLYQVNVEYAFASRLNSGPLFTIITGVLSNRPGNRNDLIPAYKDQTGNGSDSDVGFRWLDKKYEFTVRSNEQGALYVIIGIWGTWEVGHIYYIDSVRVSITKKPEGTQFYSFENDLEGWTANVTDLESGVGSITPSQEIWEDGTTSLKFDLNSLNGKGKIWIERAFAVEPKKKYKVNLDYAFHSNDCGDTPRFRIITGVFRERPQAGDDLTPAFQEKTTSDGCTWGWLNKSYQFTVKSKKSNLLYVVIGIYGTEQARRTYNFDSVSVTITKK